MAITRCALLLFGLLLAAAAPVSAQAGRAELNGTVFDAAKAVLPGATVVAVHEATNLERVTTTGPDGRFVIPTLMPGTYTVRVELQGFQAQVQPGLALGVGQELSVDFTLSLAGVAEQITVTAQTPVVEVTASRIGTNVTPAEIDNLPSVGRNQLSLMQLVPGLVPSLAPGTFEGGQFNANGRDTGGNLFMLDGVFNNDERNGGSAGPQATLTLDAMAEYQVLTHQYTAEYGGSSGVVVNAVSKSGGNDLNGRAFYYFQDSALNATDPFVKARGEESADSGSDVFGFNIGGPLVRNRAFWFVNVERNIIDQAVQLEFPPEAAPVAVSFNDVNAIRSINTFIRGDYHIGRGHNASFRWSRQATTNIGENWEANRSTRENIQTEHDAGDHMFNGNWTMILGNRATNEVKVGHIRESVLDGNVPYFDEDMNFIELGGRDQFDIGSDNRHPDFAAGPRATHGQAKGRTYVVSNDFTIVRSGWAGDHTFKVGGSYNWVRVRPQIAGANDLGTFEFRHNFPYDPAAPQTYPSRFSIRLGQIYFNFDDHRTNWYVQDKWQVNQRLTLNLGVRHDYQSFTPGSKAALAPRLGVAYDPTGTGRTLIRGGLGQFYEYAVATGHGLLRQQPVISPAFIFDTGEDRSADRAVIPSHACLQPANNNGLAIIGPACRALLTNIRNQVLAGGFINTEPILDHPDRRLGYLLGYSFGVKRELFRNVAVSVDYAGNVGWDQTALIDINEGPVGPDGRVTRLGPALFDPTGELIPPEARNANFLRVQQYLTGEDLNTDFNSLEVSLEKRYANRWSGRFAYTLSRSRNVGTQGGGNSLINKRVAYDLNPRDDYGLSNFDNRHAVAFSANVTPWRGLGAGAVFRYYSGNPINEIIGSDVNGDRDNFDRPVRGVDDLTRPILSPVDANGRAIRNGIPGEEQLLLDLRLQYTVDVPRGQSVGLFWEVYNATNRVNFGNPTGNRLSRSFMIPVAAGDPRTMQLGIRYSF